MTDQVKEHLEDLGLQVNQKPVTAHLARLRVDLGLSGPEDHQQEPFGDSSYDRSPSPCFLLATNGSLLQWLRLAKTRAVGMAKRRGPPRPFLARGSTTSANESTCVIPTPAAQVLPDPELGAGRSSAWRPARRFAPPTITRSGGRS